MKQFTTLILSLIIPFSVFARGLTDAQKQAVYEASDYGLCQELKVRAPKGDEALIQVNCDSIIKVFELKIEKAALVKRINAIEAELKKAEASKIELP